MKKFVQNIWMRLVACVLCTLSVFGMVVTVVGMLFYAEYPDKEDFYETGMERLMLNYALYAADNYDLLKDNKFFESSNVYITVEKTEFLSEMDDVGSVTVCYSNMPEGAEPTYQNKFYMAEYKHYSLKSIWAALGSDYYEEFHTYTATTPVTGYIFDANTGLFYYVTPVGYFKADYVYVSQDGVSYDYRLTIRNGEEFYYNSYYDRTLDFVAYENWDWVSLSGMRMAISEENNSNTLLILKDSSVVEENLRMENYYLNGLSLYYVSEQTNYVTVSMAVADNLTYSDFLCEYQSMTDTIYSLQDKIIGIQSLSLIILIFAIVLLAVSAPGEKESLRFFHKIPVLIFTGITIVIETLLIAGLLQLVCWVMDGAVAADVQTFTWIVAEFALVILFVAFVYLANIITRIKTKTFGRYSEWYYLSRPLVYMGRLLQENATLFWKGIGIVMGISAVEMVLLYKMRWEPDNLFIGFLIGKVIEIPLIIAILFQMKRLLEGAKRVASGDLSQAIDTSKLVGEFKKHGENINKVGEGISLAVEEKMKSERFKTELITNVSHDIKTPLTSIINYVDLIKKEEITDPTMTEYVDVLDRQSVRLKKLIEDLMEASKASTGNIAVHFEECNVDVLLTQVIGEFEDKLMAIGLEVVVDKPEEPVMVIADGRHMWRVLDNLMNNVCKYAQPNTRVYVSLVKEGQTASIVFKNISKTALNIPSDQLMQRFVRGDSSRHTEGSGLGLSIAQSLTELMNGNLKLDIDGDLFKVTLKFNVGIVKEKQ